METVVKEMKGGRAGGALGMFVKDLKEWIWEATLK